MIVVWDVRDDSGKVVRWQADLASVETELSSGLTKNSLKPGDPITVTVHPAKDGSPHAIAVELKSGDGTILCGPCTGQKGPGRNSGNNY